MFACSYNQNCIFRKFLSSFAKYRRGIDKFGGASTSRHMLSELQEMAAMLNAWFKM